MKTKSLIETNPYLKDPLLRRELVARSVRTSGGVEGILLDPSNIIEIEIPRRKDKKIYLLSKLIASVE
jgi:hypothetical protein